MTTLTYEGRVAIVTGAGGGLGREHARLLAARGAQVVVNDLGGSVSGEGSDAGPAARVAAEIEASGGIAIADVNSVATAQGGEAIVRTAMDAFGRVDIVINNAGILRDKSFHNMGPELVDAVIDVHLKGAFNVTRPAYIAMREQGYGRIVNTSSAAGIFGNFGQTNYSAAKMGLVGLTLTLAQEGAKHGIHANVVAPAARTRMTEDLLGKLADRLDPALVSPTVAWLCHEDCDANGEIFSVGGGRVARVVIGVTRGWFSPDQQVESIRDHFEEIRDDADLAFPPNAMAEIGLIRDRLRA